MKKIITLLLIVTTINASSQNIAVDTIGFYESFLITRNIDTANLIVAQFMKSFKSSFKYSKTVMPDDMDINAVVGYVSDISEPNPIQHDDIIFERFYQRSGGNRKAYKYKKAMLFYFTTYLVGQKHNDTVFVFDKVYGSFTDLFAIWKTYFNPGANQDLILNTEQDIFSYKRKNGQYASLTLKKGSRGWCIKMALSVDKPDY